MLKTTIIDVVTISELDQLKSTIPTPKSNITNFEAERWESGFYRDSNDPLGRMKCTDTGMIRKQTHPCQQSGGRLQPLIPDGGPIGNL